MVNIGVIGCGHWGPNLIRNFQHIEGARVLFACDLDKSRLDHMAKLYPAVPRTRDYRTILESQEVDAVCVATPAGTHFQIAKDALLAGKHALVEKPMTKSSREAQELIKLAKNKGRILMVSHTVEYNASVSALRELVQKGELGNILYISMTRLNLGIFRDDSNVVWDLCPHDISMAHSILGQSPITVQAIGAAHYKKGVADVAFLFLSYPNDMFAHIHVSWIDPSKARRVVVVGDKKMALFDDLNDTEPLKIYGKNVAKPPYHDTFGDFKLLHNWGDVYAPKIQRGEPLAVECAHFIDCVRRKTNPRSDGASGLRVVQVLQAAEESLQHNGRMVEIKS